MGSKLFRLDYLNGFMLRPRLVTGGSTWQIFKGLSKEVINIEIYFSAPWLGTRSTCSHSSYSHKVWLRRRSLQVIPADIRDLLPR
jgi:hypothetical protein